MKSLFAIDVFINERPHYISKGKIYLKILNMNINSCCILDDYSYYLLIKAQILKEELEFLEASPFYPLYLNTIGVIEYHR